MGPVLLTREAADGDEWAQCYSEENMRMALNGPSVLHTSISFLSCRHLDVTFQPQTFVTAYVITWTIIGTIQLFFCTSNPHTPP
jgi:hypothetical protein